MLSAVSALRISTGIAATCNFSRSFFGLFTASYPVNDQFIPIPEETSVDDLPSPYHLMTSAVIYTSYPDDPDFEQNISNVLAEIRDGKWFVSMECLFQGFDYSLKSAEGSYTNIPRNENTAI